jgi:cell division septal protein FtsQ
MSGAMHLVPSGRSVAAGLVVLALAAGAYVAARQTSLFGVQTVDVRGGTPALRGAVRQALAAERGESLLRVDGAAIARRLDAIPDVRGFTFDRSFPHTLRVTVRRELPVLVVRRVPGADAFLVAASGKVLRLLPHARLSRLPRLWVKKDVSLVVGAPLPRTLTPAAETVAVARSAALPGGVAAIRVGSSELTLELGSGLDIRLGDDGDLRLKLAIARRILRLSAGATAAGGYLDVAVPERPVLALKSQVGG